MIYFYLVRWLPSLFGVSTCPILALGLRRTQLRKHQNWRLGSVPMTHRSRVMQASCFKIWASEIRLLSAAALFRQWGTNNIKRSLPHQAQPRRCCERKRDGKVITGGSGQKRAPEGIASGAMVPGESTCFDVLLARLPATLAWKLGRSSQLCLKKRVGCHVGH